MTAETNQPANDHGQPELKQVLGALLFAARKPIAAGELRGVLAQLDQNGKDTAHSFGKIQESAIRTALEQLKTELGERKLGLILVEAAGGFRFQTDPAGGPWVRQLLNLDKPARLSKPALETLAIIAYRQPTTRAEIEALRGVNVDAMMRHLLELQLIRIVDRSDLPGRPLMYGTTQLFLEHFGLSSVKNLPGVEQLSRRDAERVKRTEEANIEHPTSNAQRPMEEKIAAKEGEDGKMEEANVERSTLNAQLPIEEQKTDDQQRKAEGEAEEEADDEDDDEDDDEEGDEDEDEDVEGRE